MLLWARRSDRTLYLSGTKNLCRRINAMNKRVMKRKCDGLSASRAPLHTPRHIKGSGNVTARSSRFISTTSSSALPSMKSTRTSYVDPYGEIRKVM